MMKKRKLYIVKLSVANVTTGNSDAIGAIWLSPSIRSWGASFASCVQIWRICDSLPTVD